MYSFDRLLCPTDFSDASLYALRYAAFLTGQTRGTIKSLYVDEFERSPYGHFALDETQRQAHQERVLRFAEERFTRSRDDASLPPDRCLLSSGSERPITRSSTKRRCTGTRRSSSRQADSGRRLHNCLDGRSSVLSVFAGHR